jgi:hypothetical protein
MALLVELPLCALCALIAARAARGKRPASPDQALDEDRAGAQKQNGTSLLVERL